MMGGRAVDYDTRGTIGEEPIVSFHQRRDDVCGPESREGIGPRCHLIC